MDFSVRDQEMMARLRRVGSRPASNPLSYTCVKEFVGSYPLLDNAHSSFVPDPILNTPPAVWTADPPYKKV
jgi:hypothetical protein